MRANGHGPAKAGGGGAERRSAPREFVDTGLMKALSDELRVRVYAFLCEQTAGAPEVAEALDADKGMVRHHIGTLRDGGWIDVDPAAEGRANQYRAVRRMVIPANVWERLPEAVQQQVAVRIMRLLYSDAAGSMEAGFFLRRGVHASLTPMVVDTQGQRDTKALLERTVTGLLDVQEESNGRMNEAGRTDGQGVSVTVGLVGFESLRSPTEGVRASQTVTL